MSDYEIIEFDTLQEHPDGFSSIEIGMTNHITRDDKKAELYRPDVVVTTFKEGGGMTSIETFGLKNIDCCLIHIGKDICVSLCGSGADSIIMVDHAARVTGKRSEFNSVNRDFNTGRIIVER
jgi:hypothetical protein